MSNEKITVSGPVRQSEIYVKGLMGTKPVVPFDSDKLAAQVKEKMNSNAGDYIIGGAGTDDTIRENVDAFDTLPLML